MIKYTKQLMLFKELSHKKIQVDFQGGQITSDTGILFLRETEKRIGLIEKISSSLSEWRHPSYVRHDIRHLLTQRVFQIACGYEDTNDCNELRKDGAFKIGCEELPSSEK